MRFLILGCGVFLSIAIQATWLARLNFPGGVTPDLVLIMVFSYGLLRGSDEGAFFGLCSGFLMDLITGNILGIGALVKMTAGFFAGFLEKVIFKDNLLVPALAALSGTIAFETFEMIMYLSFKTNFSFFGVFLTAVLPLSVYNMLLAPPVYYCLLKMEYFLAEKTGGE